VYEPGLPQALAVIIPPAVPSTQITKNWSLAIGCCYADITAPLGITLNQVRLAIVCVLMLDLLFYSRFLSIRNNKFTTILSRLKERLVSDTHAALPLCYVRDTMYAHRHAPFDRTGGCQWVRDKSLFSSTSLYIMTARSASMSSILILSASCPGCWGRHLDDSISGMSRVIGWAQAWCFSRPD